MLKLVEIVEIVQTLYPRHVETLDPKRVLKFQTLDPESWSVYQVEEATQKKSNGNEVCAIPYELGIELKSIWQ